MIPGYLDFEFDLPGALLQQLIHSFASIECAALNTTALADIPDAQGVYQLFLDDMLVYIGKTDAEAGLRKRLGRHSQKVMHRIGLDPARVSFKAIRVYVFTAIDLETQLIAHYGGVAAVAWNGSGFGSNDPGRNRDKMTFKANHFDALYPIDIDRDLTLQVSASSTAAAALNALKDAAPYVLRFEGDPQHPRQPHADLESTIVHLEGLGHISARRLLQSVLGKLPQGWQAVRLPSHLIVYKETDAYPQGEVIART